MARARQRRTAQLPTTSQETGRKKRMVGYAVHGPRAAQWRGAIVSGGKVARKQIACDGGCVNRVSPSPAVWDDP